MALIVATRCAACVTFNEVPRDGSDRAEAAGADAGPDDIVNFGRADVTADLGRVDVRPDATTPIDALTDRGAVDLGRDPGADAPTDTESARCTGPSSCAGDPANPACDLISGRCVRCVPSMDTCPASQHCDGTTHACVECVIAGHCRPDASCVGGVCVTTCSAPLADCDANTANGCETDTRTTIANCGACGRACPAQANATPTCAAGACGIACAPNFGNCDLSAANGCEVDLRTNATSCGMCGRRCAIQSNAAATCTDGVCGISCSAGFGDCDRLGTNGCEAPFAMDPLNCGGCGTRCPSGVCREGACQGFGGAFEVSGSGCVACSNANLLTGTCACPAGFATTFTWQVMNDCRGNGTTVGARATFCGATAGGEFGGGYQQDDAVPGNLGCRVANPYTSACSCPGGYTAIGFRTLAEGVSEPLGSNPALCVASSGPRRSFGGAFQVDDAVPGGVGCRSGNPLTGGCSCPAGYGRSSLRVRVDSSRGYIGSIISICVR